MAAPKTLIFDLMGTCLDWHNGIYKALNVALFQTTEAEGKPHPRATEISELALAWRQGFFDEILARSKWTDRALEDIDDTHRRVLKALLKKPKWEGFGSMSEENIERCVQAWHEQIAWPDIPSALAELKERYDVVVLANGTTRLQVDITKSAGLAFDMLFSSELLGITKPNPAVYRKAMELLHRTPEECVMVAAHAYDLRAAKVVGMRSAYLQRWSEDAQENMTDVKRENDWFINATETTSDSGGLLELCDVFNRTWTEQQQIFDPDVPFDH